MLETLQALSLSYVLLLLQTRGVDSHDNLTLKCTIVLSPYVKNAWSHAYILLLRHFKITR